MKLITLSNAQRARRIYAPAFKQAAEILLGTLLKLPRYQLAIHLVGKRPMARLNQQYMSHDGPTDIITLDYRTNLPSEPLQGELYICVDVAIEQAHQHRTFWQRELFRYLTHGVLHLCGYDDLKPRDRSKMKRAENLLLRKLAKCLPPSSITAKRPRTAHD